MAPIHQKKIGTTTDTKALQTPDDHSDQSAQSSDTTSLSCGVHSKARSREELKEQIGANKRSKTSGSSSDGAEVKSEIASADVFLDTIDPDLWNFSEIKNNVDDLRSSTQYSVKQELVEDKPAVQSPFFFHANQAATLEPSPNIKHSLCLDAREAITLQSPQMELQFSKIIKKANLLPHRVRTDALAEIKKILDENLDNVIQRECATLDSEDSEEKQRLFAKYVIEANVPAVFKGLLETSMLLPDVMRASFLEKIDKSMYQYPYVIFPRIAFAYTFECNMSQQEIQNRRAAY